jgi:flagellar motility protein MotE (MotC chaperone)
MADEEVTDLTEGEADAGQKKGKAPKAPKVTTPQGEVPEKGKGAKGKGKGKKGGGGGSLVIIMIVILLLTVGSFGFAVYTDFMNARAFLADVFSEPLIDAIIWLDPRFSTVNDQMQSDADAREEKLDEREAAIDEREAAVELRESVVTTREQQNERRTQELNTREDEITAMYERTIPLYRREMSQAETDEMLSIARTFTQMSPDEAAAIMVEIYDERDVAAILFFMAERNRGAILAAFEPAYAAHITEILLYF